MQGNYCVYFYLREDRTPYYIGMGRKQRPFAKHAHRQDRGDFKPENPELILLVHENLSQQEAFELEIKYIKQYGRKCDGGILINLTEGGEGAKHNEDTRKKISLSHLGKKVSEETKRKMSIAHKCKIIKPESIMKMVQTRKANGSNIPSDETRKKMSDTAIKTGKSKGSKNPAAKAILAFDRDGNLIAKYDTAREAAEALNIGKCWKHIPSVCKGIRKHTCGYVFKYFCEED